jgi:S1-C subfamily serine protease
VVFISNTAIQRDLWSFDILEVPQGSGSGFVWNKQGHIVTNFHVIYGANAIKVTLADRTEHQAKLVGADPDHDLAVLQVQVPEAILEALAVGTSQDLRVGQKVLAIGNPFGLDHTLTTGVVSALGRTIKSLSNRTIEGVVQTDAAINPGNSGGPLLDSAGRLIGVTTAIFSPSGANAGIGFAIPSKVVNRIVPELIAKGRVPTPGIGIMAGDEDLATRAGVHGLIVGEVVPGSPAERAGLRGIDEQAGHLGDVIVGVNERPVARLSDFTDALEKTKIGDTVSLKIQRNSGTVELAVQVIDIGEKNSGE